MSVQSALEALQRTPRFMKRIMAWRVFASRPPRYGPWPATLHPRVRNLVEQLGIPRLYIHQSQGLHYLLAGRNVMVVTATASGKSLVYQLATLHFLLSDPKARVLYIFPTKALAQDQADALRGFLRALDREAWLGVYDGDTPRAERVRIREHARVILTNPDMLHYGFLPYHTRWVSFWTGLRLLVIDEVHIYRGVFGSHVANVLRRLGRVTRFYGSHPRMVLTSATVGNPREVAQRLVERDVFLVEDDGAPQPPRTIIFYNPPLLDAATGLRRSVLFEVQQWVEHFLQHDVQTVVFTPSRRTTEVLLTYLRDTVTRLGLPPQSVRGYRGGYLPRTRREIERGIREGTVRAVVATNALELGVDIRGLGAAILLGYPGSVASTWQQFGRAGRRGEGGVGVFVAGPNALDQYLVTHPDFILSAKPEHALLAPDNLHILVDHLRCALFELPFASGETFGRFTHTQEVLDFLVERGEARSVQGRYHWLGEGHPAEEISLRTAGPERVVIQVSEEGRSRTLGEVDRASAPRLVHPGAVYLHEAIPYQVESVDWDAGVARVRRTHVEYYTQPITRETLTILQEHARENVHGVIRARGDVIVRSRVTGFRKVRWYTHEHLGYEDVDVPPQELETTAYWIAFTEEVLDRLRSVGAWRSDAIEDYGPNWEQQRRRALERDGYRCRRCGAPHTPERPLHVHHIRPFRTFGYVPGVNDAYKAANRLDNLITLCSRCHRLAEAGVRLRTGFSGLAYAIGQLAPLFAVTAAGDIGQVVEAQGVATGLPTITLYDNVPGGIGLAERLYEVHEELLAAALERVERCECEHGCPACVGPVLVEEEGGWDTKRLTRALLRVALGMDVA